MQKKGYITEENDPRLTPEDREQLSELYRVLENISYAAGDLDNYQMVWDKLKELREISGFLAGTDQLKKLDEAMSILEICIDTDREHAVGFEIFSVLDEVRDINRDRRAAGKVPFWLDLEKYDLQDNVPEIF